jgi:putative endonuclease
MQQHRYWTYMLTNWNKTVLYTGVTNNLAVRLIEHWIGIEGSFTSRYKVYCLVWSEETSYVLNAINLEKRLKLAYRSQKHQLISDTNPAWLFRNSEVLGVWPPTQIQIEEVQERWRKEREANSLDSLSFLRQRQVPDKDSG